MTISLVIGQNGIIGKANEAKVAQELAEERDQIQLKILDIVANKLSKGQTATIEEIKTGLLESGLATEVNTTTGEITTAKGNKITDLLNEYIGKQETEPDGANAPQLAEGMTPVKWNGSTWENTTENDSSWYNYNNKQWANVKLQDGSMLVWIPRYAYKITSKLHQSGADAGNIEVVFVNTSNQDQNGDTYSTTYPTVENNAMTNYVVHPAFVNYDGKELSGIWVGKYESSNDGSDNIKIVAGVESWRNISVNNIYNKCVSMKNAGNVYGLEAANSDPHMIKNTEWGACAYLAQSKIGKQAEVSINDSSSYITGTGGVAASTTGNETGIYDMSGGAWDYVAAYINNGDNSLKTNAQSLLDAPAKHKDIYAVGSPENGENNYNANSNKYGDAIWETSEAESGEKAWYSDFSNFSYWNTTFLYRGGNWGNNTHAGVYAFNYEDGHGYTYYGFRTCIVSL